MNLAVKYAGAVVFCFVLAVVLYLGAVVSVYVLAWIVDLIQRIG